MRWAAAVAVLFVGLTACGDVGGGVSVPGPGIPSGVVGAIHLDLGGATVDTAEVPAGAGVFLTPDSRIAFAGVACQGAVDEGLTVKADGEVVATLQPARLAMTVTGAGVSPVGEGGVELRVPDGEEQGLALSSISGVAVDDDLVNVAGVYEPHSDDTPFLERFVGGTFVLVVRCGG